MLNGYTQLPHSDVVFIQENLKLKQMLNNPLRPLHNAKKIMGGARFRNAKNTFFMRARRLPEPGFVSDTAWARVSARRAVPTSPQEVGIHIGSQHNRTFLKSSLLCLKVSEPRSKEEMRIESSTLPLTDVSALFPNGSIVDRLVKVGKRKKQGDTLGESKAKIEMMEDSPAKKMLLKQLSTIAVRLQEADDVEKAAEYNVEEEKEQAEGNDNGETGMGGNEAKKRMVERDVIEAKEAYTKALTVVEGIEVTLNQMQESKVSIEDAKLCRELTDKLELCKIQAEVARIELSLIHKRSVEDSNPVKLVKGHGVKEPSRRFVERNRSHITTVDPGVIAASISESGVKVGEIRQGFKMLFKLDSQENELASIKTDYARKQRERLEKEQYEKDTALNDQQKAVELENAMARSYINGVAHKKLHKIHVESATTKPSPFPLGRPRIFSSDGLEKVEQDGAAIEFGGNRASSSGGLMSTERMRNMEASLSSLEQLVYNAVKRNGPNTEPSTATGEIVQDGAQPRAIFYAEGHAVDLKGPAALLAEELHGISKGLGGLRKAVGKKSSETLARHRDAEGTQVRATHMVSSRSRLRPPQ